MGVPRPSVGSRAIARRRRRATEPPSASRPIRVTPASVIRSPASSSNRSSLSLISLVRPRRRLSLAPTAGCRGRRAQGVSRLAALQRPPAGLGLDTPEHDGTLVRSGPDELPSSLCLTIEPSWAIWSDEQQKVWAAPSFGPSALSRVGPYRAAKTPRDRAACGVSSDSGYGPCRGSSRLAVPHHRHVTAVVVVQAACTRARSLKTIVSD